MLFTFETRLNVSPEMDALLSANARYWSWGQRTAWSKLYRQKQSPAQAYAELQKLGFTSHQTRSILTAVQMKHKALVETKQFEEGQLQSAITQREGALKKKQKRSPTWKNSAASNSNGDTSSSPKTASHARRSSSPCGPNCARSRLSWNSAAIGSNRKRKC